MKNRLQIDVKGPTAENDKIIECKLLFNGNAHKVYLSKSSYEALIGDGFFIRDGQTPDSAGILNTSKVFNDQ